MFLLCRFTSAPPSLRLSSRLAIPVRLLRESGSRGGGSELDVVPRFIRRLRYRACVILLVKGSPRRREVINLHVIILP